MLIQFADFNGADEILAGSAAPEWADLEHVLTGLPLHLKASDQAGRVGTSIFDVVGTNQGIKDGLIVRGWRAGIPIPAAYSFLGTDVDYCKAGTLAEVQFSNYPFLLNNTVRSELFFKAGVTFTERPVEAVVIVTKGHMFPASNSTLYYEQGRQQLEALHRHDVFDAPVRLVGLFSPLGENRAIWTDYSNARYSRTVGGRSEVDVMIAPGRTQGSRATLTRL